MAQKAFTQLFHRRERESGRLRRFLLLRPFGPALEIDDVEHPPELPAYDAARDLEPRTPQFVEHTLTASERGKGGRPGLPVVTGALAVDCDLSGACCSQYPVIPTTPEESRRAVEALKKFEPGKAPMKPEDGFAPSTLGRRDRLTPILEGDGCTFLTSEGCRIHKLAGAAAKPWTCRQYPLQVVHCGNQFEVSILPQCACAARTVHRSEDADEWPANPLQGLTTVPEVPPQVRVDDARSLPRAAYLEWARALSDVLTVPGMDPVRILESATTSLRVPGGTLSEAWLRTLQTRMASEAERLETYLDPAGPQPKGARWVAKLAESLLRKPHPKPTPSASDGMVFALAFRAHLLLELPSLAATLCDLTRIARLAGLARATMPAEKVDARLETTTLLLYLWATTRWPVASEKA
ncbi:hypothetical protein LZC95_38925 [Pendulispora brunnea]|uniref:YkgJ family cysteine cluster protein n=1 Tax=Pendulispora brunnea TaxID=2905690 RepID=A0ABZ2K0Z5_9BACT